LGSDISLGVADLVPKSEQRPGDGTVVRGAGELALQLPIGTKRRRVDGLDV
jgi:hypothetical protein